MLSFSPLGHPHCMDKGRMNQTGNKDMENDLLDEVVNDNGVGGGKEGLKATRNLRELHTRYLKNLQTI